MIRHTCLILLPLFLTGCYTSIYAPGAKGRIVDANTGMPVQNAQVTRPAQKYEPWRTGMPEEGLPASSVSSDKRGLFNLPPAVHTQIAFMVLLPSSLPGSFLISAPGYVPDELHGIATSSNRWRVDLGTIALKRE